MKGFIRRHGEKILGVLSGFDRMRFRGTLRLLTSVGGTMAWLSRAGVLIKDFVKFAEGLTRQVRQATEENAAAAERPVRYLDRFVNKEELVRRIRGEQGLAANGLIAVLSTLEACASYDVYRNAQTHQIELRRRQRKCLHFLRGSGQDYFYWEDERFGLTQVRLQTWFPFNVHVVLNGREWLARELDRAKLALSLEGIGYLRRDNCFADIEDFARAQKLADRQPRITWWKQLERLLRRVHPLHRRLWKASPLDYYWTSEQTEWATDLAFRDAEALAELHDPLIHRGMEMFQSADVLRFLGHKLPGHGGVHGKFAGEVVSDLKARPEGLRLKHRAGRNTLKMYDKQGTVPSKLRTSLRVETTLNDPRALKVYRRKQGDEAGPRQWLPLRKLALSREGSVADLTRRAELSQAANERYLEALGTLNTDTPLKQLTDKLCRPVHDGKRRYRGLRPFDPQEVKLLEVISRGEYQIAGFRNRDVRQTIYAATDDDRIRRRQSAAVTRQLAILRAHGLIKKIPRTHRYLLTQQGTTVMAALLAARNATLAQLNAA